MKVKVNDLATQDKEKICPLVNGPCINMKCLMYSNQLSACSLLWQGIQLEEIQLRLGAIESELVTLQD